MKEFYDCVRKIKIALVKYLFLMGDDVGIKKKTLKNIYNLNGRWQCWITVGIDFGVIYLCRTEVVRLGNYPIKIIRRMGELCGVQITC